MSEPAGARPKVFISHAKEDHAFACAIFASLRKDGVAAWMQRPPDDFALEGILPGQDSALQIEQRLSEADALLLILSPASIAQQGHVEPEFRLALHAAARRGLPIVGVLQSACDLPAFAAGGVALDALRWIDHSVQGPGAVDRRRHARRQRRPNPLPRTRARKNPARSGSRESAGAQPWAACIGATRRSWRTAGFI